MSFFDKVKDVTYVNDFKQFLHRGSNEIFVANIDKICTFNKGVLDAVDTDKSCTKVGKWRFSLQLEKENQWRQLANPDSPGKMAVETVLVCLVVILEMILLIECLYVKLSGSMDPYSRAPRSRSQVDGLVQSSTPDDCKASPVGDQVVLLTYLISGGGCGLYAGAACS